MNEQIFISYSRKDKDQVFAIQKEVENATGAKCWIDLNGIESDKQFVDIIISAIRRTDIFLFMYSVSSEASPWTRKELEFASRKGKRIVFINIDKSELSDYFDFQFGGHDIIDWSNPDQHEKVLRNLKEWTAPLENSTEEIATDAKEEASKEDKKIETKKKPTKAKTTKKVATKQKSAEESGMTISSGQHFGPNGEYLGFTTDSGDHIGPAGEYLGHTDSSGITTGPAGEFLGHTNPFENVSISVDNHVEPAKPKAKKTAPKEKAAEVPKSVAKKETAEPKAKRVVEMKVVKKQTAPSPEYVDLGLSVCWATCNLGATKPEENGDYYAWGEIKPKPVEQFTKAHYALGTPQGSKMVISKYNNKDKLIQLESVDDAATHLYGDEWSIPTQEQFKELKKNCKFSRIDDSRHGYMCTSQINGKSIFFPCGGRVNNGKLREKDESVVIWTSDKNNTENDAVYLWLSRFISSVSFNLWTRDRWDGFSIRPVKRK